MQQYEEGPDELVGLCQAWDALLLCSGLQAIALVLIRAEGRVYDVQLPFACLTHDSYQLYTIHLQEQEKASWLLQSAHGRCGDSRALVHLSNCIHHKSHALK